MELAKYLRNTRRSPDASAVDASTEDGYLERLTRPAGSIRRILDKEPQLPPPRVDLITEEFAKTANPKRLHEWLLRQDTPIEELTREAEIDNPNGSLQTAEEQVHFFASTLPALIEYLQARNIPATGANLRALNKLAGRRSALADALADAEADEELPLTDTSLEGLLDGITGRTITRQEAPPKVNWTKEAYEEQEEETERTTGVRTILRHDISTKRIMTEAWAALDGKLPTPPVTSAKEVFALQNRLNGEDGYSIPIRVNGKPSTLSLYVLNKRALTEDGANVYLSLDTVNLGVVQGYFTVKDGGMDLRINTRDEEAAKALTAQLDMLKDTLADSGISLSNVEITADGVQAEAPPQDMPVINPPEPGKARVPLSAYDYLV
jgi:hypothetical protein